MSIKVGDHFEKMAQDYLANQGLRLLEKNYRAPCGEIDLIMQHDEYCVFVEVRYRTSGVEGQALASITPAKQKRLFKTAQHYLVSKGKYDKIPARFDVVALQGFNQQISVEWLQNVLQN